MEKIIKTTAEKQKIKEEINKINDRLNQLGTSEFLDEVEIEPGTTYTGFERGSESLSLSQQRAELEYILSNSITPEQLHYQEQKEIEEKELKRKKRSEIAKKAAATRKARKVEKEKLKIDVSYMSALHYANNKNKNSTWSGIKLVPAGTLIDDIISEFEIGTSLPLDIPFNLFFGILSGYLCKKNIKIKIPNSRNPEKFQEMFSDFWIIVLAKSCSGKTWTFNAFRDGFLSEIDDIVFEVNSSGSAAFLQELQKHNKGLWVRDEVLQFFQQIENPNSRLGEVKDYMLRLYDNATLERITKQDNIVVKNPAIALIGTNTPETFTSKMTTESLTDGFSQRFSYILAEQEDEKSPRFWKNVAQWSVNPAGWAEKWKIMTANIQDEYIVSTAGLESYSKLFKEYSTNAQVDESFFRRVYWKIHKFALLYHLLNFQAEDKYLQKIDYSWAARLIERQLSDAYKIVNMASQGRLGKIIDNSEKVIKRLIENGKVPTPRDLISLVRDIKTTAEAENILKMLFHKNNVKPIQTLNNTAIAE